ncbi:hypothetical protein BDN70DRAFT_885900 [Pholiota conissans]|uniref:Uncharacterized protein n=1 Tax=Pholiota conissans TaxID=109636 RepID=A0A9P5YRG2_9AGAR|nr:hypothetical protein BDN70DRAFT_885900 [Pholiota conissans]
MHYSPSAFNSLPSLKAAEENFNVKEARQFLEGPIRQAFLDFGVQEKYGIALLHNHFPLQANQRLVDYRNTATAWLVDDEVSPVSTKYNGQIVPRAYMFEKDDIVPYEFSFVSAAENDGVTDVATDVQFFNVLNQTLTSLGLEKLFGVRDLRDHDNNLGVEITEGEANIMLPHDGTHSPSELIEALWVFGPKTAPCYCLCYCARSCGRHWRCHC